MKEIQKR